MLAYLGIFIINLTLDSLVASYLELPGQPTTKN